MDAERRRKKLVSEDAIIARYSHFQILCREPPHQIHFARKTQSPVCLVSATLEIEYATLQSRFGSFREEKEDRRDAVQKLMNSREKT